MNKQLITIVGILLMNNLCFANSNEAGNGGVGLRVSPTEIHLLDLRDAGVASNPHFDSNVKTDPVLLEKIENTFQGLAVTVPSKLIASKLSEIMKLDTTFAVVMTKWISLYEWIFREDGIIDTHDENTDIVHLPSDRVQLALRSGLNIKIATPEWTQLAPSHQAALVLHEIFYAMTQSATRAHALVGYLFRPGFIEKGRDRFLTMLGAKNLELTGLSGGTPVRVTFNGDNLFLQETDVQLAVIKSKITYSIYENGNRDQDYHSEELVRRSYAIASTNVNELEQVISNVCENWAGTNMASYREDEIRTVRYVLNGLLWSKIRSVQFTIDASNKDRAILATMEFKYLNQRPYFAHYGSSITDLYHFDNFRNKKGIYLNAWSHDFVPSFEHVRYYNLDSINVEQCKKTWLPVAKTLIPENSKIVGE